MSEKAFLILIALVAVVSILELFLGLRGVDVLDKRFIGLSATTLLLTFIVFVFGPKPISFFFIPAVVVKGWGLYMTCKIYSSRKKGK